MTAATWFAGEQTWLSFIIGEVAVGLLVWTACMTTIIMALFEWRKR